MAIVQVAIVRKKGVADVTKRGVADVTKKGVANVRMAIVTQSANGSESCKASLASSKVTPLLSVSPFWLPLLLSALTIFTFIRVNVQFWAQSFVGNCVPSRKQCCKRWL